MKAGSRPLRSVLALARCMPLLLAACLAGCTVGPITLFGPPPVQTLTLGAVLPLSGADAQMGQAMEHGVELAAHQNAVPGKGFSLVVRPVDEASASFAQSAAALTADKTVVGVVGPLGSTTASTLVPMVERLHLATISPGAVMADPTTSTQQTPDGVDYPSLHLPGTTLAFFQLAALDSAASAAAKLAVAPTSAHGLGAHSVFVVSDDSPAGQEQATFFAQALGTAGGSTAGTATVTLGTPDDAEAAVIAIIQADPDAVFYAGSTQGGADLRRTLTLSGAPQVPILTTAPIADNPGWSAAVGQAAASAYTVGLLPGQPTTPSAAATAFATAYHSAYGQTPPPQAAQAYDAAMDEIAAIKSLIAAGKPVTRDAVLSHVASSTYAGITGSLAFDANGMPRTADAFGIYACQSSGAWKLVGTRSS